jgi:hypothetical protein
MYHPGTKLARRDHRQWRHKRRRSEHSRWAGWPLTEWYRKCRVTCLTLAVLGSGQRLSGVLSELFHPVFVKTCDSPPTPWPLCF